MTAIATIPDPAVVVSSTKEENPMVALLVTFNAEVNFTFPILEERYPPLFNLAYSVLPDPSETPCLYLLLTEYNPK